MPVFHVEMRWRCSACQGEVLGRFKACQHCGKAKEGEPFYDGPGTVSPTVRDAVTDPALVAQATAGPDWGCRYCGSHQRRGDGACANCGAQQQEAARPAFYLAPKVGHQQLPPEVGHQELPPKVGQGQFAQYADGANAAGARAAQMPPWVAAPVPAPAAPAHRWLEVLRANRALAILALFATLFALSMYFLLRTRVVTATVIDRTWKHTVSVERYMVLDGQGFDEQKPSRAFDVRGLGQRHHHDDRVQDGYTRESYTEDVACGQTCTTTPVSCTVNDNGFKTCSGGDQTCSTKYCSETRYRDVPKYKDVPVYEEYYAWKVWDWALHRTLVEWGTDEEPFWPSAEKVAINRGLSAGEKERTKEEAGYHVVFLDRDDERHEYVPKDLAEFKSLKKGAERKVRVGILRDATIEPY